MRARLGLLALSAALYGCVAPAKLETRASTDFGRVLVGTTATRASGATWTNTGEKSGRIAALTLSGSEASSFASDPRTMMGRVRPGEVTQPITGVSFAPLRRGGHVAILSPVMVESDATANGVILGGSGENVFSESTLSVLEAGGGLPDPDKPLNCGRTLYTTSVSCTFIVRNDAQAVANVVIVVPPAATPAAFRVTSPTATPPTPTVPIAPGARQTITVQFTPPSQAPVEMLFTGGVIVMTGPGNVSGRALCGVGFRTPETPPPAGTASLACP